MTKGDVWHAGEKTARELVRWKTDVMSRFMICFTLTNLTAALSKSLWRSAFVFNTFLLWKKRSNSKHSACCWTPGLCEAQAIIALNKSLLSEGSHEIAHKNIQGWRNKRTPRLWSKRNFRLFWSRIHKTRQRFVLHEAQARQAALRWRKAMFEREGMPWRQNSLFSLRRFLFRCDSPKCEWIDKNAKRCFGRYIFHTMSALVMEIAGRLQRSQLLVVAMQAIWKITQRIEQLSCVVCECVKLISG